MGSVHSNSRDEEISPNDLRLVRHEAAKLFAMDARKSGHKSHAMKGRQHSNRWNIQRVLDSAHIEVLIGDSKSDGTAASSCSSSPILPTFPQLGSNRRIVADSNEKQLTQVNNQSAQFLRPGGHGIRKSQRREVSGRDNLKETETFLESNFDPIETARSPSMTNEYRNTPESGRSRPIPVNRRQVSSLSMTCNEDMYTSDVVEENHLKEIHDLRTWEMYIRISEARKKAANTRISTNTTLISYVPITNNLQFPIAIQECGGGQHFKNRYMIPYLPSEEILDGEADQSSSQVAVEHEMIFGDLDD